MTRSEEPTSARGVAGAPPPAYVPGPDFDRFVDGGGLDDDLRRALDEDRGTGDVTSEVTVPAQALAGGVLRAKADGVVSGLRVFARVFALCDPEVSLRVDGRDGQRVGPGDELVRVEGNARALLLGERTALNYVQRLSGVATRTAAMVALVAGLPVRLLDTRKTTPGLRWLEKYGVRCGGGHNHRIGLWDEAMVKENHLALAGRPMVDVLADLRLRMGPQGRITAEAETAAEALAAVRGGADVVLLDDMPPSDMADLCPRLRALAAERGRPLEIEASGGVNEGTLRTIAQSGVDRISIGALTHSVTALDLSFKLAPLLERTLPVGLSLGAPERA